jgi:hypothetical protein
VHESLSFTVRDAEIEKEGFENIYGLKSGLIEEA